MKKQLLVILVLAVVAVVLNLTACGSAAPYDHETTGLPFDPDPAVVPSEVTCYEFVKVEMPPCYYSTPNNRRSEATGGEECTEADEAAIQDAKDMREKIVQILKNEEFEKVEFDEESVYFTTFDLDEFDYILIREISSASDVNVEEGCYVYPKVLAEGRPAPESDNKDEE